MLKPKIIIDARESGTSTGRYIDKLLQYLHNIPSDYSFIIVTRPNRVAFMKSIAPNFETQAAPFKEFTFSEQIGFKNFLTSLKPDLVHFGMVQQPILYSGLVVTTIHDLTTLRYMNPDKNALVFAIKQQVYKHVVKRAARKSVALLTPSEYVKKDVVNYAAIADKNIAVTYEAADKITDLATAIDGLLGRKFIMYIGRATPHKNLDRLIQAFEIVREAQPEVVLVLAGKLDMNYRRLQSSLSPSIRSSVMFTDFVTEGQLRWLYENCRAYVFPSLSEGFGLPGLEAMAHGAPVVSSNTTCLPEIYGVAAHYFDPLDVGGMAHAIGQVLENASLRQKLIVNGYRQVQKYSWERMAEQTLDVYKKALLGAR